MSDPTTPKKPVPLTESVAPAPSGESRFFAEMHAEANKAAWAKNKVNAVIEKAQIAAKDELTSHRGIIRTATTFAKDHRWGLITASVVATIAVGYAITRALQRDSAPAPSWADRAQTSAPADRSIG